MATSKCPYCGRDVFGFEWTCPGCGKDIRGRAAESGADGSPPTPGRDKAVLVVVCPACDKSHKVPRHSVGRKARCSCGNIMVLAEPPEAESSGASAAPGGKHSAAPLEERMCPQCGMVYSKDKPHNCEQRTCPTCGKWYWSSRPHTCTEVEPRSMEPVRVSFQAKLWPRWKCGECGGWVLYDPAKSPLCLLLCAFLGFFFSAFPGIDWRMSVAQLQDLGYYSGSAFGSIESAQTLFWAVFVFSSALLVGGLMLLAAYPPYLCTSCGRRAMRPPGRPHLPEE